MAAFSTLPKHDGWPIERLVPLMAGSVVLTSLTLGRKVSPKWRTLTGIAGGNLVMYSVVGWCPVSLALERAGVPRTATQD